jgi:hypothetical protein
VFVTVWLVLAAVATIAAQLANGAYPLWFTCGIASIGLYRAIDLLISFFRAGVFLSFRGDIDLAHEPRWRIQRLLLATFINFFELILWYGTIYHYASLALVTKAPQTAISVFTAVNSSFATMSTLGNAIIPTTWLMTTLVIAQWFTSILMLVVVVGLLVSLLSADQDGKTLTSGASPRSGWLSPLAVTGLLLTACYICLWLDFTR